MDGTIAGAARIALAAAAAMLAACGERAGDPGATEAAAGAGATRAATTGEALLERGEYLVTIMDCTGCHTTGVMKGAPEPDGFLAGSAEGFQVGPEGVYYPPNLTPHPEAGLGAWSDEEIDAAIRQGVRPDGRKLAPIMPSRNYAVLSDEDARAVVAYLRSLPPSPHQVPEPATPQTATSPFAALVLPEEGELKAVQ